MQTVVMSRVNPMSLSTSPLLFRTGSGFSQSSLLRISPPGFSFITWERICPKPSGLLARNMYNSPFTW
ncbi:hypothetical protein D3C75_1233320 [compost metagenome]